LAGVAVMDARTPTTYFYDQHQRTRMAMEQLRGRLDDLLIRIQSLKEEQARTPAHQQIIEDEIDKAELEHYTEVSKQNALRVVEAFSYGKPTDARDAVLEALDWKAFVRVHPYMIDAGENMENQVFGEE